MLAEGEDMMKIRRVTISVCESTVRLLVGEGVVQKR